MANVENSSVKIDQVPVGQFKNFSYIVSDNETKDAIIFDPAFEVQRLIGTLNDRKLGLAFIVNTHSHFDHIEGNRELQDKTGAKIVMSSKSLARKDIAVNDGDRMKVGKNVTLSFLLTPGHSQESMCIVVNSLAVITGDTLFIGECGRVDLPGGNSSELFESFEKLRSLNPDLTVFPGHDYGPKPSTTLREQM